MLRKLIAVLVVAAVSVSVFGDYILDREAAVKLQRSRKYKEALAAFLKMAGGKVSDVQKSDALHMAALCAYGLKDREQAMALAKQIPIEGESKATRLVLMNWTRKWKEAAAEFKSDDIETWPDHVKYQAYSARGYCALRVKDAELAVADFTKAAEYGQNSNDRSLAFCNLGDVYRSLLKDDDKSLVAYRRVLAEKHLYKGSRACLSIAGILTKRGKLEEALSALDWPDMKKLRGAYRAWILAERGKVLTVMGKKAEAIAEYGKALAVKGLPAYTRKSCEKALKKLQGGDDK